MVELLSYLLVLAAYLPGLWLLKGGNHLRRAPLLLFAFLGMFVFNAIGSVLVMTRHYNYFGTLLSPQYVVMLILQVFIFYILVVPYLRWKALVGPPSKSPSGALPIDNIFPFVLGILTVIILALYLRESGGFLVGDLISGKLNSRTVLEYRARTYGLANFRFYRLGFLVLPAMVGAHLVLVSMRDRNLSYSRLTGLFACFIPPLLMAEKVGILYLMLVLLAAWFVGRRSFSHIAGTRARVHITMALVLAMVPTAAIYLMYYSGGDSALTELPQLLLFRTFGSYTESIAAAVPFAKDAGWLQGRSFPNVGNLLPWQRLNIEAALHHYMTHWNVVFDFTGLAGSASLPAVAEGYVNFGWVGFVGTALIWFLTLIVFQEILDRLRLRVVAQVLTYWYAYLALFTSLTSLFATLISLIHTLVALLVYLIYLGLYVSLARLRLRRSS